MAIKKLRVFFPLGNQYYMESPWVQINGKPAYEPVSGQPRFLLKDVVEEAVEKRQAVIDPAMCITDCYSNKPVQNSASSQGSKGFSRGEGQSPEYDQMEITLSQITADGTVRLGLSDRDLGIFGGVLPVADATQTTVGGTFGTSTIDVIGRLANYGFLEITKIHFEADVQGFFATTPLLKVFSHTGTCLKNQRIHYPKALAEDDNTNIRTMDEKYIADNNLDLTLNGKNFLEILIPKDRSVNMTVYTCFFPKS